jgi:hypothetical protein
MGRRKTPYQPRLDWAEVSEDNLPPFGRTVLVALVKRNGQRTLTAARLRHSAKAPFYTWKLFSPDRLDRTSISHWRDLPEPPQPTADDDGPDTDELLVRLITMADEAAEASHTHDSVS